MSIRIIHSSDLHLGLGFSRGYPAEVQKALASRRLECLEELVELANDKSADLFVISGDLFDRQNVARQLVADAAAMLNQFQGGAVLIIPGNHDYYKPGSDSFWDSFVENSQEHVMFLRECKAVDLRRLSLDIVAYPCPCTSRHSTENAVGWVAEARKTYEDAYHLGIAHGSVEELSLDLEQVYYPMTKRQLESLGLDIWLLGHTHCPYPSAEDQNQRIFLAGTPEPDGFDCSHPGQVWWINLDGRQVGHEAIQTGRYRFLQKEVTLNRDEDLDQLETVLEGPDTEYDLVRLVLKGHLDRAGLEEVGRLIGRLEEAVLHLQTERTDLRQRLTVEEIDREFSEGSFPHRLLSELAYGAGPSRSLQLAYELIQEAKRCS
jgi:DNA repair exonuclease SbcCD nuclease subunit